MRKNPFSELRLGGFGVLKAIAGQVWGQEAIRDTPGEMEAIFEQNILFYSF
jgi:hypothetical protein